MWSFEEMYADQVRDLIRYSSLVYDRNLVSAAGGNISVRCKDAILITASNVSLREVDADHLLLCDMNGKVLEGNPDRRPSKELFFHLSVYKNRKDAGAVIHAHPKYCIAYTLEGELLPMVTVSARMKLVHVPNVPAALPGTKELAGKVEEVIRKMPMEECALVLEQHGCITFGPMLKECFDTAELLEDTAHIAMLGEVRRNRRERE